MRLDDGSLGLGLLDRLGLGLGWGLLKGLGLGLGSVLLDRLGLGLRWEVVLGRRCGGWIIDRMLTVMPVAVMRQRAPLGCLHSHLLEKRERHLREKLTNPVFVSRVSARQTYLGVLLDLGAPLPSLRKNGAHHTLGAALRGNGVDSAV